MIGDDLEKIRVDGHDARVTQDEQHKPASTEMGMRLRVMNGTFRRRMLETRISPAMTPT